VQTVRPQVGIDLPVAEADDQLFDCVLKGEYCYILTPRQMGKSSLMIRTAERLRHQGFRAAIIDLMAEISASDSIGRISI